MKAMMIGGLVLVLLLANVTIWQRQTVVDNGQPLLLKLRPVDPRSLMQGDYMNLAYDDQLFPPRGERDTLPMQGLFVVRVDDDDVATFSRRYDGGSLGNDERLLAYKLVDASGRIRLGAEAFFFQEGRAQDFENAEYGVLHVDEQGRSVLVGLAGKDRELIR